MGIIKTIIFVYKNVCFYLFSGDYLLLRETYYQTDKLFMTEFVLMKLSKL